MVLQRTQKRNINIGKRKIRTIRDHGPQGKTVLQEEASGQVLDSAKKLCERLIHTIWTKEHHTRESCFGGWGGWGDLFPVCGHYNTKLLIRHMGLAWCWVEFCTASNSQQFSLGCGYHLEKRNDNRASSFRFIFPLKKCMEFPPCSSLCKHKMPPHPPNLENGFFFPHPLEQLPRSDCSALIRRAPPNPEESLSGIWVWEPI